MNTPRGPERRAPDRPSNGDTAPCPKCMTGTVEFNERFRIVLSTGRTVTAPAWVCDSPSCGYRRLARREDAHRQLHMATPTDQTPS